MRCSARDKWSYEVIPSLGVFGSDPEELPYRFQSFAKCLLTPCMQQCMLRSCAILPWSFMSTNNTYFGVKSFGMMVTRIPSAKFRDEDLTD